MIETETIQKLLAGGEWMVPSASGEIFDAINPANSTVLATLPDGGREDTQQAIDAAATAQPGWAETTPAYTSPETSGAS